MQVLLNLCSVVIYRHNFRYNDLGLYMARRFSKNEGGVALILALIVMTMLSLLVISSLELLTTNIRITGNHIHDIQALYVADAGIENAIKQIRDNPTSPPETVSGTVTDSSENSYSYSASITGIDPIVITSTGTVKNLQRRIRAEVRLVGLPPTSVIVTSWVLVEM